MAKGPGKGNTNNPNGRPAGVPNKATTAIKEAFQNLIEQNTPNMIKWLERVAKDNPAKALELIGSLAEYVVPKLSRAELTGKDGKPLMPPTQDDKNNLERFYREKFKRDKELTNDRQSGAAGDEPAGTEGDGE